MTTNELQSKTIDWLRFPLAVAVVFIHSGASSFAYMQRIDFSSLSGMEIYRLIGSWGAIVLPGIAVPCFFMFSGFLFFLKIKTWNKSVYTNKIKSRFKTLIIPYLLWNLITVFVNMVQSFIKMDGSIWIFLNDLYDKGLGRIFWDFGDLGGTNLLGWVVPGDCPYLVSMWFLKNLIIITLLSPLVYYFIKLRQ
jgi:surface polysaccharide O-acyltransferase-like enzyme